MIFGRNKEQDKTTYRIQEWQRPFLLFALSPFVIFDSDYEMILYPLCKSNTLLNILIFGRNVEEVWMMCHIQE